MKEYARIKHNMDLQSSAVQGGMGPEYTENGDIVRPPLSGEGMARVGEEAIEDDDFDE